MAITLAPLVTSSGIGESLLRICRYKSRKGIRRLDNSDRIYAWIASVRSLHRTTDNVFFSVDTDGTAGDGIRHSVIEQCFLEFFPIAPRKTKCRKKFRLPGALRM